MQAETYLLLCQRYVELNLVRAGMVSDPGDYPWSSYRATASRQANVILSPHTLYLGLAADDATRHEVYRDLFRTALDDAPFADLRMALNQDQPLGNNRFYAEIEAMAGQRRETGKRGRPRKTNDKEPLRETGQQKLSLWFN